MSKSMRAAAGVMTLVAVLAGLSLAQAFVPAASAAKPPKPTPTATGPTPTPPTIPAGLRAGLRASNYGITPFPSPTWWVDSIGSMASRFPGSIREQVAVVVEVSGGGGRGNCWAHFPQPASGTWPNVNWDDVDLFESTFDAFDASGVKVWLQVEPARCDVPMLIDLMYQQYGHHSSVIGFGVDVEWYRKDLSRTGKPVTDAEAQAWVARTRTYDPADLVLVKHWLTEKMPPTYRTGLVFVDDSQGHGSLGAMVSEFSAWGETFAPAPVGYQYGYQSDKSWWSTLPDPPRNIGNALVSAIPNTRDLVWVDFTAYDIWPPE
jgi:hypothetical protein